MAETNKSAKPGFFERAKTFVKSVVNEMKKVVWPNKHDLLVYTGVVLGVSLVLAIIIWGLDLGIGWILGLIIE